MTRARFGEEARERIRGAVRAEASRPAQPQVDALVAALRERFGPCFAGALYYGSCRRQTTPEGIIDLHVLVTDLRQALGPWAAALCRLLPPNVYYLEVQHAGTTVRCKYALLSLQQFERGCTTATFHSYFWGRYAQPLTVLGAAAPERLVDALADAVETLAWRALPRLGSPAHWRDYWVGALRLCYRAELRPEDGGRAATLVDADPAYYARTGEALLAGRAAAPRSRATARLGWGVRIVVGKLVSLLRLLKGLYTFDGGIDYVAWKLERHTGRPVEISDRLRRRPLLYVWPLLWRLWREGSFR